MHYLSARGDKQDKGQLCGFMRDTPQRYLKTTGGCLIEEGDVMAPLSRPSRSLPFFAFLSVDVFPLCLCPCASRLFHSCLIDATLQRLSGRQEDRVVVGEGGLTCC